MNFVVRNNFVFVKTKFLRLAHTLWLQIIPRRHSEFSQPAPRGFACSQNIAVVRTKRKKAPKGAFCSLCAPSWNRTNDLILKRDLLYQLSYGRITTQIYRK